MVDKNDKIIRFHKIALFCNNSKKKTDSDRFERDISDRTIRIRNFNLSQKVWQKKSRKFPKFIWFWKAHNFQTIKDIYLKCNANDLVYVLNNFRDVRNWREHQGWVCWGRFISNPIYDCRCRSNISLHRSQWYID